MIYGQGDNLHFEFTDVEIEIIDDLRTLIRCGWDSNNIKLELQSLIKQFDQLHDEIAEQEKQKSPVIHHDEFR